jgi:hypothetical protein
VVKILISIIAMAPVALCAQQIDLKTAEGYELALQYSNYKYEEPDLMTNKGSKFGVEINSSKKNYDYFLTGSLRYAVGDVKYTGSGTSSGNEDHLWDLRLVGGKDIDIKNYVFAPYIGLGRRNLFNDLRGTSSTGAVGYRRNSEYIYNLIGVSHRVKLDGESRITTTIEYNNLFSGRQKSYLSDVSAAYAAVFGDPVNKQTKGHGGKVSLSYERSNWSTGIFYSRWNIGDSQVNTFTSGGTTYSVYEPKNNTNEIGVQVKYRFK